MTREFYCLQRKDLAERNAKLEKDLQEARERLEEEKQLREELEAKKMTPKKKGDKRKARTRLLRPWPRIAMSEAHPPTRRATRPVAAAAAVQEAQSRRRGWCVPEMCGSTLVQRTDFPSACSRRRTG